MSAPLVIFGVHCRFCRALIPDSIKEAHGNDATGYVCPGCIVLQTDKMLELGAELSSITTQELDCPGTPAPCAMCGAKYRSAMRLVTIDGRMGLICADLTARDGSKIERCESKWVQKNREKVGPKLMHELKLK